MNLQWRCQVVSSLLLGVVLPGEVDVVADVVVDVCSTRLVSAV